MWIALPILCFSFLITLFIPNDTISLSAKIFGLIICMVIILTGIKITYDKIKKEFVELLTVSNICLLTAIIKENNTLKSEEVKEKEITHE
jgi:uncharacterized membrane protein